MQTVLSINIGKSTNWDRLFPWLVFLASAIFHTVRLAYYDWGWELVPAYIFSDAELYLHMAWFKAFVDFDGGMLKDIIPLSPYVLSQVLAYKLLGPHIVTPHITNSLLTSGAAVFMYLFAKNLFGNRVGLISAIILILCGPLLFYVGLTIKVPSTAFLLTAGLYFLERSIHTLQVRYMAMLSIFAVMLILERNNFLLEAPLILLIAFITPVSRKIITRRLLCLTIPGIAVFTMFSIVFDSSHTTSPFALNVYTGNSRIATGAYVNIPGIRDNLIGQRQDLAHYPERKLGRELTDSEAAKYWISATLSDIYAHPLDFIKLLGKKCLMMLSRDAPGAPEYYALWRWHDPFLSVAAFDYGLILALAIPGLIIAWRNHPDRFRIRIFAAIPLVYSVGIVAFFILERYRFPVMIALIPFAAYTLATLFGRSRQKLKIGILTVTITMYLISFLLNSINPTGPGWSANPDKERELISKRIGENKLVYEYKYKAVQANDPYYWQELQTIYFKRRMREDARIFALRVKELSR